MCGDLAHPQEAVGATEAVLAETAVAALFRVASPGEEGAAGGVVVAQTAGSGVGASLAEALAGAVGVGNIGALAHAIGSGFKIDGGLRNASKHCEWVKSWSRLGVQ